MNQQPQPQPVSLDEFLPILMASEIKLELIDGQIEAFADGTFAHIMLCERVVQALRSRAKPGFEVFNSDMALRAANPPTYVFPNATYTNEPLDADTDSIVAPCLIVEVVSPNSVERDRVAKLDAYRAIPSVQEYLVIDSRRIAACMHRRQDQRTWAHVSFELHDTIELASMENARIPMSELYAGMTNIIGQAAP